MENTFKVICLVEDFKNGFTALIVDVPEKSKGDALISVLMVLDALGLSLNAVKKTKVFCL